MPDFSQLQADSQRIQAELAKTVVRQEPFVEQLLVALLAGGHCLVEGPPGAARALTARGLAAVCGLRFDRIRCTPDLTPAELVIGGSAADEERARAAAALFANIVLLDDIRRLSPKTSALVQQALEGQHVTVDGRRHEMPEPYLVLATSYAEEEEPVDPVADPQDDRFMLKLSLPYPSYGAEYELAGTTTGAGDQPLEQVWSAADVLRYRNAVRQVDAPPPAIHYAVRLVRATRVHEGETPDFVYEWVGAGAGPRAARYLILAAKVRAGLHGRPAAEISDVQALAHAVLRHRIITNQNARLNGVSVDKVIDRLLYEIPQREPGDDEPPQA